MHSSCMVVLTVACSCDSEMPLGHSNITTKSMHGRACMVCPGACKYLPTDNLQ